MIAESSSAEYFFPPKLAIKLALRLAHLAFHEIDNLLRFRDCVVPRDRTDHDRVGVEQDHRGRDAFVFGIGNDLRLTVRVDVRHG